MADVRVEEKYIALGKMVTWARLLEQEAYQVARALGVLDPENLNITPALRAATRQARQGLPPWSRDLSLEQIESWVDTALPVLDERNREVHGEQYSRLEVGGWTQYRGSLRGKDVVPQLSVEDLEKLSRRAEATSHAAREIRKRLMFEIQPGVFHWHLHLGRPEKAPVEIAYTKGKWPVPTREEIHGWYEELMRTSPPEWASWPHERHQQQRK